MRRCRKMIVWLMTLMMIFGSVQWSFAASETMNSESTGSTDVVQNNEQQADDETAGDAEEINAILQQLEGSSAGENSVSTQAARANVQVNNEAEVAVTLSTVKSINVAEETTQAAEAELIVKDSDNKEVYNSKADTHQMNLKPGEYTYVASDVNQKGSKTEGAFTVEENTPLTKKIYLPYFFWLEFDCTESLSMRSTIQNAASGDNNVVAYVPETLGAGKVKLQDVYIGYNPQKPYLNALDSTDTQKKYVYVSDTKVKIEIRNGDSWEVYDVYDGSTKLNGVMNLELNGAITEYRFTAVNEYFEGCTQTQTAYVKLSRYPVLSEIKVYDGEEQLVICPVESPASSGLNHVFNPTYLDYFVQTNADNLTISATCYKDYYTMKIGGKTVSLDKQKGSATVSVGDEPVVIELADKDGQTAQYTIKRDTSSKHKVTINIPEGTKLNYLKKTSNAVVDGKWTENIVEECIPETVSDDNAVYSLEEGRMVTYEYETRFKTTGSDDPNQYYYARGQFTVSENDGDVVVNAAAPRKDAVISQLRVASSNNLGNKRTQEYDLDKDFQPNVHEYVVYIPDQASSVNVLADLDDNGVGEIVFTNSNGKAATCSFKTNQYSELKHCYCTSFCNIGSKGNNAAIYVGETENGIEYGTQYNITAERILTVGDMSLSRNNDGTSEEIPFLNSEGKVEDYYYKQSDYSVTIDKSMSEVVLNIQCSPVKNHNISTVGEHQLIIGKGTGSDEKIIKTIKNTDELPSKKNPKAPVHKVSIPLNTNASEELIWIKAEPIDGYNAKSGLYQIKITKGNKINLKFDVTPKNASTYIADAFGNAVSPNEDGSYSIMSNAGCAYTVTAPGYIGQSGEINFEEDTTFKVELKKAEENAAIDVELDSQWPGYSKDNNTVVKLPTPTNAADAVLYWANQIGAGWAGQAVGSPILVDGYLYTYSGNNIYKVDTMTGEVVAEGAMTGASAFAITSPTYAEGMIFIALANGQIQAFNAKTLESLWIYKAPKGGQPNSPIIYSNGYIYTGFWNSETKEANYICLTVTDEDPQNNMETKIPSWVRNEDGGFYWAGAHASGNYVIVGTDDGESGYTKGSGDLLSIDPKTGALVDRFENIATGDIRSSICYDSDTGMYYFTSKGGYFCGVKVKADGTFDRESFKSIRLTHGQSTNLGLTPAMSTSTPVVYNGRAYIGVSGTSQFGAYSGHNITVIDLSSMSIAYRVDTKGYPQTSGLLTNYYEEDGSVYVYFFDNYTPGQLRVLKDKPGQTEAELTEIEKDTLGNEHEVAQALFTPYGYQAEYAISSPIVDEYGNMYFKNDSGHVMALGSTITKLEVTKQPKKTAYVAGETFKPDGMEVTATYANGKTRDVSKYVKYTTDILTVDDDNISIWFDLGDYQQMYQNKDGAAGTKYIVPETGVDIVVASSPCKTHAWNDGEVTKEATYKEAGNIHYSCTKCGAEKDEVIPVKLVGDEQITVPDAPKSGSRPFLGMDADSQDAAKGILQETVRLQFASEIQNALDAGGTVRIELNGRNINKTDAGTDVTSIDTALDFLKENKKATGAAILSYMDITAKLIVTDADGGVTVKSISTLSEPVRFKINVPDAFWSDAYTYYVFRVHNGETEVLEVEKAKDEHAVYFESHLFSTYALAALKIPAADGGNAGSIENNGAASSGSGTTGSGLNAMTKTAALSSGSAGTTMGAASVSDNEMMDAADTAVMSEDADLTQKNSDDDSWSVINLLIALITLAICVVMLIDLMRNRQTGMRRIMSIVGIAPALAAIITFFITQDLSAHMGYMDKYTMIMAAILLAQLVVLFFSRASQSNSDEYDEFDEFDE